MSVDGGDEMFGHEGVVDDDGMLDPAHVDSSDTDLVVDADEADETSDSSSTSSGTTSGATSVGGSLTPLEVEEIEGVLEELEPRQRQLLIRMIAKSHSGPLPDVDTFAGYEAVFPGAAAEILASARENRRHRFSMDHKLADTARLSLYVTGGSVTLCLVTGLVLGLNDQPVLGGIFGVGGLAPVLIGMLRGGGRWAGK